MMISKAIRIFLNSSLGRHMLLFLLGAGPGVELIHMTIISSTVGSNPLEEME